MVDGAKPKLNKMLASIFQGNEALLPPHSLGVFLPPFFIVFLLFVSRPFSYVIQQNCHQIVIHLFTILLTYYIQHSLFCYPERTGAPLSPGSVA
ncbi:hypothetical protein HD806DRAFT_180020 [Xylariaceae sp. AK1471]|nr:hypothetical protein HD806DRAFT_180020 [Xylariaceae sp. AK1471]